MPTTRLIVARSSVKCINVLGASRSVIDHGESNEIGGGQLDGKSLALSLEESVGLIEFIEGKVMPIVVRHAISGTANVNSEDALFEDPTALAMLIDIFSERGFHATVDVTRVAMPLRVDLQSGEIHSEHKKVFGFNVRFKNAEIRG